MSQNEVSEKKKGKFGCGAIALLILLILIGAAGYLYYSVVKMPAVMDDPRSMAASAPMSPAERYQFSSGDQTVQVRLDKGDLWTLILAEVGDNFLDVLNEELSAYSLSVSGCAIRMGEDGLWVDAELFRGDTRILARVLCDLEVSGEEFCLIPSKVKLGAISLPLERLLSMVELEYELNLPVISQVTQISYTQDAIVLTGSMEEDIRLLTPGEESLYRAELYQKSLQPMAKYLRTRDGVSSLLAYLEQKPAQVEEVYQDLFLLAEPEILEEYLDSRSSLIHRFLPGIKISAIAQEHTRQAEEQNAMHRSLEQFFTMVVCDYNDKKFTLSDGQFLKNKKPFQASDYATEELENLFQVLDPDSFFLVLVDAEDGFIRKTSSFYRMADENQQFTQSVDFNKTYILGCVFRSAAGEPFLLYETEQTMGNTYSRCVTVAALAEEEAAALNVPGMFGVWTD